MDSYSVQVELDLPSTRRAVEKADEWLDELAPVAGVPIGIPAPGGGRVAILCTVDAPTVEVAVGTALAVVRPVVKRAVVSVEAMLREERDKRDEAAGELARAGTADLPELVSATEAGVILGVGSQRVRELVADGRLVAQAVGERKFLAIAKSSAEHLATVERKPGRPTRAKA